MVASKADAQLDRFERFAAELRLPREPGDFGPPPRLIIEPFRRAILWDYFNGCVETVILIPRKNGKTTLLAALVLYHLLVTDNAKCVVVAESKEQAAVLYETAVAFVRDSGLEEFYDIDSTSTKIIRSTRDSGSIRVMASDAATLQGQKLTLGIIDELHASKSIDHYDAIQRSLVPGAQMITITTAGESDVSPLGQIKLAALKMRDVRVDGCYTVARDDENQFALHQFALPDTATEDDWTNWELVKQANPLSSWTPDRIRLEYNRPSTSRSGHLRYRCGLFVAGEHAAIDALEWKACGGGFGLEEGEHCWLGIDAAFRYDTFGLVPYVLDPEGIDEDEDSDESRELDIFGVPTCLHPPKDGSIKVRDAVEVIRSIHKVNPIDVIVWDPNKTILLRELMEDDPELGEIRIIEHSQSPYAMVEACEGLFQAINAKKVVHPDDVTLTEHVLNCAWKSSDQQRFVKRAGGGNIDLAIAAAMVRNKAHQEAAKAPKHNPISAEERRATYERIRQIQAAA